MRCKNKELTGEEKERNWRGGGVKRMEKRKRQRRFYVSMLSAIKHSHSPYLSKHITLLQPLSIVWSNNRKTLYQNTEPPNVKFITTEAHLFFLGRNRIKAGEFLYVGFALKYTEGALALWCMYVLPLLPAPIFPLLKLCRMLILYQMQCLKSLSPFRFKREIQREEERTLWRDGQLSTWKMKQRWE